MKQAKSSELVKEHHEILKGDGEDGKINRIRDKKKRPSRDKGKVPENSKDQKNSTRPPVKKCYRCGKSPHKSEECPAINATCRKCKNRGHYASECKSKVVLSVDDERQDRNSDEDCYFLGAVDDIKSFLFISRIINQKWYPKFAIFLYHAHKVDNGSYSLRNFT